MEIEALEPQIKHLLSLSLSNRMDHRKIHGLKKQQTDPWRAQFCNALLWDSVLTGKVPFRGRKGPMCTWETSIPQGNYFKETIEKEKDKIKSGICEIENPFLSDQPCQLKHDPLNEISQWIWFS